MSWDFRVGQKVVCIDDDDTSYAGDRELICGAIYTIRWVGSFDHPLLGEDVCVRLNEVTRKRGFPDDCPFAARRFRPLVQRATDISVFTAMLNPSKQRVDA